eukprot:GEMP01008954.1.p1 GENE.GEMP01008954.1~~GEMP01008954.1.p1  ORF type:complete len:647 (+),score=146.89 GEMP01008954.1:609-2549(+)
MDDIISCLPSGLADFTQEIVYSVLFLLVFLAAELFSLRLKKNKKSFAGALHPVLKDGQPSSGRVNDHGSSKETSLERDEALIMHQLGGDTKTSGELVQAIIDMPRKEYLGSFDRVMVLVTIMLKNSPEVGSMNWRAPRDVIVRWLLERNPTPEEFYRVLQLIDRSGRKLLCMDIFLQYGERVGRKNLRKKYHKNKKVLYATATLVLKVLAQLKKREHFPRVVSMLPLEDIKSETVIQLFVTVGIECQHLMATEVALLDSMFSGNFSNVNWGKIFHMLLTAYVQAKSFYAAQNFVTKVRQLGLPAEEVDGLEFRLQYEKDKVNGSTISPTNSSTTMEDRSSLDENWRSPKSSPHGSRTVRWYTTAISDCGEKGDWKRAIDFLEEITLVGLTPDTISYSAAINACAKGLQWEKALKLFQKMKDLGLPLNERVYGACLNACAKAKQWERALILLDEMRKKDNGVEPNVYNYGAAISACEYAKQFGQAIRVFEDMKAQGLQPNLIIYSLVISACWKADNNTMAFELYNDMKRQALVPNAITYRLLVSGSAKAGNWANVEILKEDIQRHGVQLAHNDAHTFNTLAEYLRDHSSSTSSQDNNSALSSIITPSSSSVSSARETSCSLPMEQCGLSHREIVRPGDDNSPVILHI